MRRALVFTMVFALPGAGAVHGGGTAGGQFQARCVRCHQPPDLNFATDRAFLDQVHRTS
jgi:hypothetical protein